MRSLFLAVEAVNVQLSVLEDLVIEVGGAIVCGNKPSPVDMAMIPAQFMELLKAQQRFNEQVLSELTSHGDRPHGSV